MDSVMAVSDNSWIGFLAAGVAAEVADRVRVRRSRRGVGAQDRPAAEAPYHLGVMRSHRPSDTVGTGSPGR